MKSHESLIRLKRFQVSEKKRQLVQIEIMIDEFAKMRTDLDSQIEREEEKAGISDVSHFAYPAFAKAARTRRDSIDTYVAEWQGQQNNTQLSLGEAEAALKKVELLETHG